MSVLGNATLLDYRLITAHLMVLLWLVEDLTLFVGGVVDVGLVIVVGG